MLVCISRQTGNRTDTAVATKRVRIKKKRERKERNTDSVDSKQSWTLSVYAEADDEEGSPPTVIRSSENLALLRNFSVY